MRPEIDAFGDIAKAAGIAGPSAKCGPKPGPRRIHRF